MIAAAAGLLPPLAGALLQEAIDVAVIRERPAGAAGSSRRTAGEFRVRTIPAGARRIRIDEMSTGSRTRVLIAGAGIGGMETALALRALAGDRVEVELLDPAVELTLAAESTAHPFGRRPRTVPLTPLVRLAEARLRHERLEEVLPEEGLALTDAGAALGYDRLVVAVGARAEPFMDGVVTFRGPSDVLAVRRIVVGSCGAAPRGLQTRLAFVVPPGGAWPLPAYESPSRPIACSGGAASVTLSSSPWSPRRTRR